MWCRRPAIARGSVPLDAVDVPKGQDGRQRTGKALEFRRAGELLTQNLHKLKRGMKSVTLTEYREDGTTADVEVTLDPKRSPQQEVEWRFHQYKRMLRGAEMAKERLRTLDAEGEALQAQFRVVVRGTAASSAALAFGSPDASAPSTSISSLSKLRTNASTSCRASASPML